MRRGTGTRRRWLGMAVEELLEGGAVGQGDGPAAAGKPMADSDQASSPAASSRRRIPRAAAATAR